MIDPGSQEPVSDGLLDQATRFRARLADAPQDKALIAQIDQWKAQDARQEAAWEEGGRLWSMMEPAVRHAVDPRRRRWMAPAALAASLLVAVLMTPAMLRLAQDLRSDVVAPTGVRRVIALADGSTIILNSDTALAVNLDEQGRRSARLFRGEAFFSIHHDPSRPFEIDADGTRIAVLGTRFDVRIGSRGVKVAVEDGRVRFASEGTTSTLAAGEQGVAIRDNIAKSRVSGPDIAAWREGRVVFYNAKIADVVEELNRYRSGPIVLMDRTLGNRRITANFRIDNPARSLDALLRGIDGRVTRLPGDIVLLY